MTDMPTTLQTLQRVRRLIPPLRAAFHKGQLGRIAVLGGCDAYAGAPFFSAMASARLGCDLSHVVCTPAAAAVIKTYSPDLMVHPLLAESDDNNRAEIDEEADKVADRVIALLPRLHVLVVGPGLGRDTLMQATAARVVTAAREAGLPLVLDADALLLLQTQPDLVRGYRQAVLTPNVAEFGRLADALLAGKEDRSAAALSRSLGGVTVLQKGRVDTVASATDSGVHVLVSDGAGSRKRSGGQGDTLTGTVATFLGWRRAYLDGLWDTGADRLEADETVLLAAFGGSAVTRAAARRAFAKHGRSLQASDLTAEVHAAFEDLFGEEEEGADEGGESKL